MIDPDVVTALVLFLVTAGLATLGAGIRRIPWRYGVAAGLWIATALVAAWAADRRLLDDPGMLVLVGALGGSQALLALDRGERERRRISDEITTIREAHFT